jgi:DNA-binding response OmpR family regulator
MDTPAGKPHSRILCVGLADDLCQRLKVKLEPQGFHIIATLTFAEALNKINSESFDQCIFAEQLPDGTSLNLCKLIRQTDSRTPIIFYSPNPSPTVIRKALQIGANAFFSKIEDWNFEE